ncbi:glucose-6-phosphate isomerase [Kistimonas asteriae]|uniref:glucose-6-phosphate isomerase n=1 Tax=Kistimonas asteriae TaxID=517724 RepID=UPI001BABF660|nr:glucose-6-phosphate isomerase [Kistimonas asteriae]
MKTPPIEQQPGLPSPLRQYAVSPSLETHCKNLAETPLARLMEQPERCRQLTIDAAGLCLDYSRHRVTTESLSDLIKLAREARLEECREAMFSGSTINTSEQRAVLHTALRNRSQRPVLVEGSDVMPAIRDTLDRMRALCQRVHSGEWTGYTGKPIKHIVNIGIGGSFLGVKTALDGLRPFHREGLTAHYVVNVDPADLAATLKMIDPETTLFIVASKSFSTLETRVNAEAAKAWMLEQGMPEQDSHRHFVAVSNNIDKATQFGIAPDNILPLWDWVGGRYSLWSAIGLMIPLMTSFTVFERLLHGAYSMDEHFRIAPLEQNMPVIMALLGIWYSNYFGAQSHAVLTYASDLEAFPAHLQQMDMESNGKRVTADGQPVSWQTGPVIWGGVGTNGQHAYHQLLHQGTRLIPVDIIVPMVSQAPIGEQQDWLFAHALAQSQALALGCSEEKIRNDLSKEGVSQKVIDTLAPQKTIPGNKPASLLVMESLTPEALGALIALYEHKIFVQGVIWGINSFDQFGVELGKVLGDQIFEQLHGTTPCASEDPALKQWIQRYRRVHNRCNNNR